MTEKPEWEVIDAPPHQRQQHAYSSLRPSLQQLMKGLLGRWWLWKILGVLALASIALVVFATVAGVAVLLFSVAAVIALGMNKFRQWTARRNGIAPH